MLNSPRSRVGFLINPIAGMGGSVGLKGTNGKVQEAITRGAKPLATEKAKAFLRLFFPQLSSLSLFTASDNMGQRELKELGISFSIVYCSQEQSTSEDTKAACKAFLEKDVEFIIFCGGDGTARDIASVVSQVPILGIPAGVKMHSGVFAISPEAAAEIAVGYLRGELKTRETEIVDVDEEKYRLGKLETRLYATSRTPYKPVLIQERKRIYFSRNEEDSKYQIASFAKEFMRDGSAYIVGAGTTTSKIAELLGLEKTLLGVDVIQNGELKMKDASEQDLLDLLGREKNVKIIVSPIGAQGFILGRGSQQISAEVVRRAGRENLIVVSSPHKLAELPNLLIYTGDAELDRILAVRRQVVTGYRIAQLKEVKAASDYGLQS